MFLLKYAAPLLISALPRCKAATSAGLPDASPASTSSMTPQYTRGPGKAAMDAPVPTGDLLGLWQRDMSHRTPHMRRESEAHVGYPETETSVAEGGSSGDVEVDFLKKLIEIKKADVLSAAVKALWYFATAHNNASGLPVSGAVPLRSSFPVLSPPATAPLFGRREPSLPSTVAPPSTTSTTTTTTTTKTASTTTTATRTSTTTTTTTTKTTTTLRKRRKWPRSTSSTRSPPFIRNA